MDADRGFINFYKDGNDLGQAFVHAHIKHGDLVPLLVTQCECSLTIFHPSVFPLAAAPPVEPVPPLEPIVTEPSSGMRESVGRA